MKTTLIAVFAVTVVLGVAGNAQTMVEYQTLANGATRAVKTTPAVPRVAQQAATAPASGTTQAPGTAARPPAPDPNAPQAVIWEAPEIPGKKKPAPAHPTPPAVFVLSNGDRLETARYLVTVNSVRVEQDGAQRTIPLSDLNMDATVAANKERGLNIKFPTDKTQIMLGF